MTKKNKDVKYFEAVGRRKLSIARVMLYLVGKDKTAQLGDKKIKEGEVYYNGRLLDQAVTVGYERDYMLLPLKVTGNEKRFAVSVKVSGGGKNSQLEAVAHGLSQALDLVDATYRQTLKKYGLLRRDDRARERRKVGTGGKARRVKQSPKR